MNVKRLTIGSLTGLVVLYILGIVIWQMVFADFFAANRGSATGVDRDPQIAWAIVLGSLMYAKLLALAIESGSGSASIADGFKIGATVGILLWGSVDFILYGYMNLNNLTAVIADTLLEGVRGGVAGAVIAGVLARTGD